MKLNREVYSVLSALGLIVSSMQCSAEAFGPSSADFLASCQSRENTHTGYCIGYLKAYRDWYIVLGENIANFAPTNLQYCEPKTIDYRIMQQAVVKYLENNSTALSEPRIVGVGLALSAAWPCSSKNTLMLQGHLQLLGYYTGDLTGIYDITTRTATEKYQKDNNLPIGLQDINQLLEIMIRELVSTKNSASAN